jgi:hypothetical protein
MTRLKTIREMTNADLIAALNQISHLESTGLWPNGMPYWVELVGNALNIGIDMNKACEEIFREAAYRFKAMAELDKVS